MLILRLETAIRAPAARGFDLSRSVDLHSVLTRYMHRFLVTRNETLTHREVHGVAHDPA
jgi:hypothetical protein